MTFCHHVEIIRGWCTIPQSVHNVFWNLQLMAGLCHCWDVNGVFAASCRVAQPWSQDKMCPLNAAKNEALLWRLTRSTMFSVWKELVSEPRFKVVHLVHSTINCRHATVLVQADFVDHSQIMRMYHFMFACTRQYQLQILSSSCATTQLSNLIN